MRKLICIFIILIMTINVTYSQIDTTKIIEKAYNICLQTYFNDKNINTPSADDWEKVTDTMYYSYKFLKQKGFENTCFFYINVQSANIKKLFNREGTDSSKFYFYTQALYFKKYFAYNKNNDCIYKLGGFYDNQIMEFFENYFLLKSYSFEVRDDKYYRKRVIRKHLPFYKSIRKMYYVEELDVVSMIKFFKSVWRNKYYKNINRLNHISSVCW